MVLIFSLISHPYQESQNTYYFYNFQAKILYNNVIITVKLILKYLKTFFLFNLINDQRHDL
jgi:hypothetical protein